ncbi:MAG: hypothetical protein K2I93_03695, partial [Oscillospiraceae bacterium]|nr:hypothetical protein [Oscillospiraceae bacterium]
MRHFLRHLASMCALLLTVQCSIVLPVRAEDIIVKQGTRIPEIITPGDTVRIQGEVTASGRIRQVTAGIYELDGTAVSEASAAPFAEVYQLARLSDGLSFDTLPEGEYLYQVTVTELNGEKTVADSQSFTVAGIAVTDMVYCTEENCFPSFLRQGDSLHFQGTVCSPTKITALTAIIVNSDGMPVSAVVLNPNAALCSLEKLGDELEIEKLQSGRYVLLVMLENEEPLPYVLINHSFLVGVGAVPPKHTAPPETVPTETTTVPTETTTVPTETTTVLTETTT